ncbi:MAG: hypothetical protein WKF43_15490, partial [Acidimicrobiales bacterium]
GQARWIDAARATADALIDLFHDDAGAGFFTTGSDGEQLIARVKDVMDNATPGANTMAANALLRLDALTGEQSYRRHAEAVLAFLGPIAGQHPSAFAHLLAAVDMVDAGLTEIAVVRALPDLVAAVQGRFLPNAVLAWGEPYASPLWQDRQPGRAYVCRDYACRAPVETVEALLGQLAPP